jgi:RecB family endonuclease NucS
MGRHKKEIIDRIKEFAQEGLYSSDTHVMYKYCNVRLEGQKKDTLTRHTTNASHLKKKNVAYLITVGLKNSDLYFSFFCE